MKFFIGYNDTVSRRSYSLLRCKHDQRRDRNVRQSPFYRYGISDEILWCCASLFPSLAVFLTQGGALGWQPAGLQPANKGDDKLSATTAH